MIRVLELRTDSDKGVLREIEPTLAYYQEVVGGLIELVSLLPGMSMYINDEGKYLGENGGPLPMNPIASSIFWSVHPEAREDFIAGNAVLIGPADDEGNDTDLPQRYIEMLKQAGLTIEQAS